MLGAMFISIAFMVLPVFRDANVTIVNVKRNKNKKHKNIFQRVYMDVILLVISLYGLYNFTEQKESLMTQMLEGESLDPFLFICSSLFIISASLVALRIQPLLIKLVYLIGKKRWKPAFFASFLQILRTKGKQSFMMVFLMLIRRVISGMKQEQHLFLKNNGRATKRSLRIIRIRKYPIRSRIFRPMRA